MTDQKCVVEGCNLEYDVVCSFSFYNVNTVHETDVARQEWISNAMKEDGECLWRHVSLHLCGYHFELDSQGLWIDSPMLPDLLTPQKTKDPIEPTEEQKKAAEVIKMDHNYNVEEPPAEPVSRLNVRQLVDTLGYLSLKNLQKKQLWVVKVDSDKSEASITQSEQVITKMSEPKQIIEIIPQELAETSSKSDTVLEEQTQDNFIYEIAEEQEISMEEVKEVPPATQEWTVNIVPDTPKSKYAFIKHCNSGKKKRHFTSEISEIDGDLDNYYILPDADPSIGVEITTTYEPENYIIEEYNQLVLDERPKKKKKEIKRKKQTTVREQVRQIKDISGDWVIDNLNFDQDDSEDFDPKKSRSRRKTKKYELDFVT